MGDDFCEQRVVVRQDARARVAGPAIEPHTLPTRRAVDHDRALTRHEAEVSLSVTQLSFYI